jgi:transposase
MLLTKVSLRALTAEERQALEQLASSRTAQARLVERARILLAIADGRPPSQVGRDLRVSRPTVYTWIHRFKEQGLRGLEDQPRSGRPHTYTAEQRVAVIAAALTDPKSLGLPFGCWTLDRLRAYLKHPNQAEPHRRDPRGRGAEVAPSRDLVRRAGRSRIRRNKGVIEALYTTPPEGGVVLCRDEMGPESAKSFPGQQLVHAASPPDAGGQAQPAERAQQEVDYGRRGTGYIFGAFRPATGAALTHPYSSRSAANWADFLGRVETWIPGEVERVYAIVDNLNAHRAVDVLLFALAFARWEFVFQPKYAAYLNLIEPWWKVLRSLALKGQRFETWEEVCRAVEEATAYWSECSHRLKAGASV